MNHIHITACLFLPLLALASGSAFSQKNQPESGQTEKVVGMGYKDTPLLETIVVTATRTEQSPFDSPMGVTVVGEQELRERAVRTPAEALRYKAGIWVQKTGHLGGAPVLRGFMGNRVVYLFDGIRRNTAGLFKGPNSFLQNVDALDVNRIEVIRGPGSVLYGSDAIGGIINVITNEKPKFSKKQKVGGRTYGRYASVDQEMSARGEIYTATQNLFVFLGGTHRDIGDLEGGRGVGTQTPSDWREHNWDAQIDYLIGKNQRLQFFVQDFSRPNGRRFDRPNWKQRNDRELYGLRYFGKAMGFVEDLKITAYMHDQKDFIDEKFWDSNKNEETWGGEIQATSFVGDSVRLVYGGHYHQDNLKKSNPQKGITDPEVDWKNPALFVLSEWQATERLRLDGGMRWDQFTLKSTAPSFVQLDPVVQKAINSGSFSLSSLNLNETDHAITGGVGMVFGLQDHLNLVGHIGRAFRAPNKSDMLSFGQFTFGFNVPSPKLKPESSRTYELGLKAAYPDISAGLTGFHTVIDDAIVSLPGTFGGSSFIDVNGDGIKDSDEQVFIKTNSSDTITVYGVEIEANWYLPQNRTAVILGNNALSVYGNASWIRGKDKGNNEPLDRAFPQNGLLGLRLESDRDPQNRRWWASIEAWLVDSFDRIPSTRINRDPAFKTNPQDKKSPLLRADGSVPGFAIYNLRGGVNITRNATITLALENFTDKKYRVKDSRIDAPGLNFIIGLDINI